VGEGERILRSHYLTAPQLLESSGGIVSTVGDMAKYMIGIMDAVNGKEGAVLRT
jgi:hypothetical protein